MVLGTVEVIKKFVSSVRLEKIALELFERLPLAFRYRVIYGPTFLYWMAFLKESEKWDKDRINAYQLEQVKNLLKHSLKNVPYYRKLFLDYGFNPDKMQDIEDFKILPYLDKETIRDRLDEFVDRSVPKNIFSRCPQVVLQAYPWIFTKPTNRKIFLLHYLITCLAEWAIPQSVEKLYSGA